MLVGLIAIPSLPIANLPNIADPLIQVSAVYGGANAEVTEQAVTNPIKPRRQRGARGRLHLLDQRHGGRQLDQRHFDPTTDIDIDPVNVHSRSLWRCRSCRNRCRPQGSR